jgi:hypothetical protein
MAAWHPIPAAVIACRSGGAAIRESGTWGKRWKGEVADGEKPGRQQEPWQRNPRSSDDMPTTGRAKGFSALHDRFAESLVDIGLEIADVLESDREPNIVLGHTGRLLFGARELLVGGRGRMNDEAFRVTDVGQM